MVSSDTLQVGESLKLYKEENYAIKDKDYCPIEIIKGLTDKGQFQ